MNQQSNPTRTIGAAVAAIVLLSACSGERDAAKCADAAETQAHAESDWAKHCKRTMLRTPKDTSMARTTT
ncbi:MAG: hypothetical protein OXN44_10940 [Acidimicrobiaceae bacterium]|nr:hypothetical protein [Acidimicrobiaceae bacterium]MDE0607318.1 hypothetical protein [Acidimicrobiaceae bacterium]